MAGSEDPVEWAGDEAAYGQRQCGRDEESEDEAGEFEHYDDREIGLVTLERR